MSKRKSSLTNK